MYVDNLTKSKPSKAIFNGAYNLFSSLFRYVDYERINIGNNLIKNAILPLAFGWRD
jgi:hypothetical protein